MNIRRNFLIFLFVLIGLSTGFSAFAASGTCPTDNGAGVVCSGGTPYFCSALSGCSAPSQCANWSGSVCSSVVEAAGRCPVNCNGADSCGFCNSCTTGNTLCGAYPNQTCKANVAVPAGCSSYNQCTNICSACSAGYELVTGTCVGATLKLGIDSVTGTFLKNSTNPLMSILSSGNVGIGATDPNDIFSIGNAGSAPAGSSNTGHNYTSTYLSADDYALVNYGLVKTLINSSASSTALFGGSLTGNIWNLNSGNVGIGTTAPNSKLNIIDGTVSELRFNSGAASLTPTLAVGNTGAGGKFAALIAGTGGAGFYYDDTGSFAINATPKANYTGNNMGSSGTARLFINTSGNVGIGTTTPAYKLDVVGNVKSKGNFISYDGNNFGGASFYSSYNYTNGEAFIKPAGSSNPTVFSPNGGVIIGPQTSNPPTNGLLVSGNLGIGTTIPNDIFSIGNSGSAPIGSDHTGHNYTMSYLTSDPYALVNYGTTMSLINAATSSSSLWGGTKNGNIWNGDAGAGNVGIGTTNPSSLLTVGGGGNNLNYTLLLNPSNNDVASLALVSTGGNGGSIFFGSSGATNGEMTYNFNVTNAFEFFGSANKTNRLLLLAPTYASFSGNVGIGTTNPMEKLQVDGNIRLQNVDTDSTIKISNILGGQYTNANIPFSAFRLSSVSGANYVLYGGGDGNYNAATQLRFYTAANQTTLNGTQRMIIFSDGSMGLGGNQTGGVLTGSSMVIDTSGNVGIGTTIPNDKLSIGNAGSAPVGSLSTGHNYTMTYLSADQYALVNYGTMMTVLNSATTTNALWNGTKNGNIWNGDTGAGNVGIGTKYPLYKLDVNGALSTVTSSPLLRLHRDYNAGFYYNQNAIFSLAGNSPVWQASTLNIAVSSADATMRDVMTLDGGNGNVGIGTTAPTGKLDVSAGLASQTAGDLVVDTASNIVYIGKLDSVSNNTNLIFRDRLGNVKSRWENAGSGSISFGNFTTNRGVTISNSVPALNATTSARFVVDSGSAAFPAAVFTNGNVGIGTTNPGAKLESVSSTGAQALFDGYSVISSSNKAYNYNGSILLGNSPSYQGVIDYYGAGSPAVLTIKNTYAGTGDLSNSRIDFTVGSVTPLSLNAAGKVGIGTSIPNDTFSIGNSGVAPIGSLATGHNYTMTYLSGDPYALVNYGTVLTLLNAATSSMSTYTQPVFVASTVNTYIGSQGGSYTGANALCAAVVSGSHVCTTGEIFNTINSGNTADIPVSTLWINNGPPGYTANANDCMGWSNAAGTNYGTVWIKTASGDGFGSLQACSNSRKYACCK